jgi:hypothetical protein
MFYLCSRSARQSACECQGITGETISKSASSFCGCTLRDTAGTGGLTTMGLTRNRCPCSESHRCNALVHEGKREVLAQFKWKYPSGRIFNINSAPEATWVRARRTTRAVAEVLVVRSACTPVRTQTFHFHGRYFRFGNMSAPNTTWAALFHATRSPLGDGVCVRCRFSLRTMHRRRCV